MVLYAKEKICVIKSIINHFWRCCATCEGSEIILREKWVSIMYHMKNKHHWEDATIYKQCDHPKLKKRGVMEKQ